MGLREPSLPTAQPQITEHPTLASRSLGPVLGCSASRPPVVADTPCPSRVAVPPRAALAVPLRGTISSAVDPHRVRQSSSVPAAQWVPLVSLPTSATFPVPT